MKKVVPLNSKHEDFIVNADIVDDDDDGIEQRVRDNDLQNEQLQQQRDENQREYDNNVVDAVVEDTNEVKEPEEKHKHKHKHKKLQLL